METVGGAVVTDVSEDGALGEAGIERLEIGALMDKAALGGGGEKVGTRRCPDPRNARKGGCPGVVEGGRHGAII